MSCHEHLDQWVGRQIDYGKIIMCSTMLHPQNDKFIVELIDTGQRKSLRRCEISDQLDKLSDVIDVRHKWYTDVYLRGV